MELNFIDALHQALWIGLYSNGDWIQSGDLAFFVLLGIVGYMYFNWSAQRNLKFVTKWEYPGTQDDAVRSIMLHRIGLVAQLILVVLLYITLRNWPL